MSAEEQERFISALVTDYPTADLEPADRVMLDYVAKLTLRPYEISMEDIQPLWEHGFNDLAIHDICTIAAYFAFVNRIANGLGVELEEE
ncbi:MAG: peroxidase [Calditrichia bacterium]